MYDTSLWERYYISRKLVLFLKQYTATLLFKVSSPLSSVFWIVSSIVPQDQSTTFKIIAVASLIGPPLYYYIMFRPFNVTIDWKQIKPKNKIVERANHRGHVYINDNDLAEVRVTVLFDNSVDSYSLTFDSDYPLEVYPGASAPSNSEYDEDENTLFANNVSNVRFFFTLKIEAESSDLNIHDPTVRIKDTYDYNLGIAEHLPGSILELVKRDPILVQFSLY